MNTSLHLLAEAANTDTFFNTEIGGVVKTFLAAIGVIVVLLAIFKATGKFFNGKGAGEGVKIILLGLVVAAFCFRPELIGTLIDAVGNIIDKIGGDVNEATTGTKG